MTKESSKSAKKQATNEQGNQSTPEVTYVNDVHDSVKEKDNGLSYDVKFSSFYTEGSVRGVCSVTIGGEIAVKGVKVIEGSKGLFVAMPSYKSGDEYKDIVYPITKEGRAKLNEAVIGAYNAQTQVNAASNSVQPQNALPEFNANDIPGMTM